MFSKIGFDRNIYKNVNLKMNEFNNYISKISNASSSANVTKSVSRLVTTPLKQLSFKDNIIDIKDGYYIAKTLMHGNAEISVKNNHSKLLLYELYPNQDITHLFSEDEFNDITKTNELIDVLSSGKPIDKIVDLIRIFMPNSKDVGARLQSLGIESGKFCEIEGYSEKLFLDNSGWMYTNEEIENLRKGYNTENWLKLGFGFTKDSAFTIDGKEYRLDNNGHLNLPEGTICVPSKVNIRK